MENDGIIPQKQFWQDFSHQPFGGQGLPLDQTGTNTPSDQLGHQGEYPNPSKIIRGMFKNSKKPWGKSLIVSWYM